MSELDDSFTKLLGRQPSDAERQQLYRVRDALGLKNNDALWLVLMALQHYQGQYEKFPQAIAQAAEDILVNLKATADATVKASAEEAKADLAQAVAAAAREVAHNTSRKQMWQWASGCIAVAFLCFSLFGWYIHNTGSIAGYGNGYGVGYSEAKDEKAAAAWANTPQGKSAYRLAFVNNFDAGRINLTTCGNAKRICIAVDKSAGEFGSQDKDIFMILKGY